MPLNFDLFTVTTAIASNIILGCIVYFSRRKSATSVLFLGLTIALSAWSLVNYSSYQTQDVGQALLLVRLVMFFAVPIGLLFLFFADSFPGEKFNTPKKYAITLMLYSGFGMVLTLTPYVFSRVTIVNGSAPKPVTAPGIIVFIIVPVMAILFGIITLFRRTKKATGQERSQYKFLSIGIIIMFALIILLNFILPSFFDNTRFIPLSALFTLPFVILTAYAIFRHHLLNMRIIGTEVLIFLLTLAMALEVILSTSIEEIIFRLCIFLLVLGVGVYLVRSVRREAEQREQLQKLTGDLEKANDQLKILDAARSEFITIASHQLRTPPATIKWYLASIIDGDFGALLPEVKNQLRKTMSTNNSMIALIDDLLNASRIERGKMEFNYGPTDMVAITETTIEQLLPQAETKKLQLTFPKPTDTIPIITADKEKLRQVINNFIDNAIKYTETGKVEVQLSKTKTDVVLKVIDTGRGVTQEQLGHVFEKFDRAMSKANNSTGLGLGLYVAKVIVEQHKGRVWVDSKGTGQGSSFNFSIPIQNNLQNDTFDLTKNQQTPPPPPPPIPLK
jgi:signal transduction histidine kinase